MKTQVNFFSLGEHQKALIKVYLVLNWDNILMALTSQFSLCKWVGLICQRISSFLSLQLWTCQPQVLPASVTPVSFWEFGLVQVFSLCNNFNSLKKVSIHKKLLLYKWTTFITTERMRYLWCLWSSTVPWRQWHSENLGSCPLYRILLGLHYPVMGTHLRPQNTEGLRASNTKTDQIQDIQWDPSPASYM